MPEKALSPIPEGMHSVTPYFLFDSNCRDALDFYKKTFGATDAAPPVMGPDGRTVLHAVIQIGDSKIMLSDMMPGESRARTQGAELKFWLYVPDCDAVFNRAVNAGCEVLMPMEDAFWGDRLGEVRDPFGYIWDIATAKWSLTPEEMEERREEWEKSLQIK